MLPVVSVSRGSKTMGLQAKTFKNLAEKPLKSEVSIVSKIRILTLTALSLQITLKHRNGKSI